MKLSAITLAFAALLLTAPACTEIDNPKDNPVETPENNGGQPSDNGNRTGEALKTLVIYYSYTGNCQQIVESLTAQITADVVRIQPADKTQKYEANNYAIGTALLNAIKDNPTSAASYPAIDPVSTNLADYEAFIIVTPLWWSQMAAILQTYLFQSGAKLAGKPVGLIVSSHSSGITGVESDAKRLVPSGKFYGESLWINNANHANRAGMIADWIKKCNIKTK